MVNFQKLNAIKDELAAAEVALVAVTKTRSYDDLRSLYNAGHKVFGENRVQELREKQAAMPQDISWHMIGHLQNNKVKYIAGFIDLIHSVDSLKLLQTIDTQARKHDRVIPCLLQLHIAEESHKFGFSHAELLDFAKNKTHEQLPNVKVIGLMGMASFVDDKVQLSNEFRSLRRAFEELKPYFGPDFKERSMGMSGDYQLAVQEGSTMVRIGSLLFS